MQATYRGHTARMRLRATAEAEASRQEYQRQQAQRREALRAESAATVIQARVRGVAQRRILAQQTGAATRIQAVARGRRDKRRVAQLIESHKEAQAAIVRCAGASVSPATPRPSLVPVDACVCADVLQQVQRHMRAGIARREIVARRAASTKIGSTGRMWVERRRFRDLRRGAMAAYTNIGVDKGGRKPLTPLAKGSQRGLQEGGRRRGRKLL